MVAGGKREMTTAEFRRKRVEKIKKIIITTCIVLLVLPTVLSIFLMIKVFGMQKQLDRMMTEKQETEISASSNVVQAKEKDLQAVSGNAVSVSGKAIEAVQKKQVYLTFDDGPGTQTEKILDILNKQKVKATFFVTGKEDSYSKKLYKRIVKEGHTLGMHSYSHIYADLYSSKKEFKRDLNQIYNLLYEATGKYPKYYRFPGGSSVTGTDIPIADLIPILEEKGIVYLDWNVISPDTVQANIPKNKMIAGILEGVSAYESSIVLMYDVADRPMTVKALPEIIKQLKKQNCELLPVDEATALIRHNS